MVASSDRFLNSLELSTATMRADRLIVAGQRIIILGVGRLRLLTSIDSTTSNVVLDALTELLEVHAACYLFESDADGTLRWVSPELCERLQIQLQELAGSNIHALDTSDDEVHHQRIEAALVSEEIFGDIPLTIDEQTTLSVAGVPMFSGSDFVGCIGVLIEQTEAVANTPPAPDDAVAQDTADEEKSQDDERLQDFIETAAQWYFEWDTTPKVTYISDGFEEVAGVNPASVIGSTPLIFEPSTTSNQMTHLQTCVDKRQSFKDIEFEIVSRDGKYRILKISGTPFYNSAGEYAGFRGCGWEITTQRQLQQQAEHEARHDPLTGLMNRREFERQLAHVAANVGAYEGDHYLVYVDLDRFKVVNDSAGHAAGDDVLCRIAQILSDSVKDHDVVARIGGDEFGILLLSCDEHGARKVFDRIINTIRDTIHDYDGRTFSVGASIGAVQITSNNLGHTESMVQADLACYAAKELGRGRYQIYNGDDPFILERELEIRLTSSVVETIRERRFILYGQPIVDIQNSQSDDDGFIEVLLRLPGVNGDRRSPASFIPIGEKHGLSIDLDLWVIETVLDSYAALMNVCQVRRRVSINLSGVSISDLKFAERAAQIVSESGVPPDRICFEVTETAAIQSIDAATKFIAVMKGIGCQFALDDFGSGFSSFSYLEDLDVDYIKIDGRFVQNLLTDPYSLAVTEAMCHVGEALNLTMIAEHVEDEKTLIQLQSMNINLGQGHYLGRPISLGDALVDIDTELLSDPESSDDSDDVVDIDEKIA